VYGIDKSQPPSQHPTLEAHPDKSGWFHCSPIDTIVDERLGIPENKARLRS
jgi:hypothetical protein